VIVGVVEMITLGCRRAEREREGNGSGLGEVKRKRRSRESLGSTRDAPRLRWFVPYQPLPPLLHLSSSSEKRHPAYQISQAQASE
jgi:hypothetical protein